jgi:bidirectional [NiFe] hydrogenase diaphorase subunit
MIEITINDQVYKIPPGRTILEACREFGIAIPTLCYHPALEPYGGCRLCMVEVAQPGRKSRLATACTYPCEDGLLVWTDSQRVKTSRRLTAELLLAGASGSPEIEALAHQLGVTEVRYHLPTSDACVLCGLCVRACQEIVGVSAIGMIRRGIAKEVSPPFQVASSVCIGCGTCVLVCPTGVLTLEQITDYHSQHRANLAGQEVSLDCELCAPQRRMAHE